MLRRGLYDASVGAARPELDPKTGKPRAWSVTQITRHIKDCIEKGYANIWVQGEVSNFKSYNSGHNYFTLKDDGAQLPAVLFRAAAERLRFAPEDGMQVLCQGRLSVYEARGQYQMIVEQMEPLGVGDLAAAFEQLKKKLAAEGLFDEERKRPLPRFPRRIGIVTSPSGAAIQDMLKVIFARWPVEIVFAGVRVQGDGASAEIVQAIRLMNRLPPALCPDVLIVGRGGGSLEDLWAFNEESVARAIAASDIPVISAVGHEVDFTISDFVADVRAATPSHAGEMVVPRLHDALDTLAALSAALPVALLHRVESARQRLKSIEQSYALRHPEDRIANLRQRLDDLMRRLEPSAERSVDVKRRQIAGLAGRLESLSPLKVLERGYSVTLHADGRKLIHSATEVAPGETIVTRLKDGQIVSVVKTVQN